MRTWGLPAEQVLRTLRDFNAAMQADGDLALQPPRRGERHPVVEPPFTAALVRAAITFTCGGLAVDLDMRVLCRRLFRLDTCPRDRTASPHRSA